MKKKKVKGLSDKELIQKYERGGKIDLDKGLKAMLKTQPTKQKK